MSASEYCTSPIITKASLLAAIRLVLASARANEVLTHMHAKAQERRICQMKVWSCIVGSALLIAAAGLFTASWCGIESKPNMGCKIL